MKRKPHPLVFERLAVVTGGAGVIGAAIAEALLAAGAAGVVLADMDGVRGRELEEELDGKFGRNRALFISHDVTSASSWRRLWDSAEAFFKLPVSLLVNNAGVRPERGFKANVDVMLQGTGEGVALALERMSQAKVG